VPQTREPGAEAEVDFADLWVVLRGIKTKVFLFTLRLSFSGKAVHRAFSTQGQEAFLEGHVHAFEQLGGTPAGKIRYDNLKSAVSRVLFGRDREESQRWIAFRSRYGFDAFWAAARKALGDSTGTRALIEVLLHRHLAHADVLAGITAALSVGSVSADVVAVEGRKAAQDRGATLSPAGAAPRRQPVVSLTERRLAGLAGDDRPLPSLAAYDDLLGKASS